MRILVVDPDFAIHGYYRQILEGEFKNLAIEFQTGMNAALEAARSRPCDLVLTDTLMEELPIFEYLKSILELVPAVLIVSSESSERFIVETLRAGALDFISKSHLKIGYFPDLIRRALLEADRSRRVREFSASLEYREEYLKVNDRIRGNLQAELVEIQRQRLSRGVVTEGKTEMKENQTYFVIFLYAFLHLPPGVTSRISEARAGNIRNRLLSELEAIAEKYGGRLWTMKEDSCIIAFVGELQMQAALAAIEMHGVMNIYNSSLEHLSEKLRLNIAISSGTTVYHAYKGDIYSEALNCAAHITAEQPLAHRLVLTSEIYDSLWPRAHKYFREAGVFEERRIFQFQRPD